MMGIIVTFTVALVGVIILVVFSLSRDPVAEAPPLHKGTVPVEGLSAVLLPCEVVVGIEDYRKLGTRPELKSIREAFWRDRRRIVLMWLSELQKDVHVLWKFRRFLVSKGLPATFQEETGMAFAAPLALLFLRGVRVAVFIFGPFAFYTTLERVESLVEWLSRFVAAPLTRVPGSKKAEIERGWSQILAIGARS